MTADWVFLLDVDNTLLDNDRIIAELGYADDLGALQRYRANIEGGSLQTQRLAVHLPPSMV
ncbi:hypothetical protein SAMN05216369_2465 [Marinobacter antarcticus]|uniref:Uncharacterized protein n=1 Tax=Marinobacter antarcticus TaxID=564117 RepID=A0A1M6TWV2_9GAMM|nr:hypothetical protein [Marinobacter antarcticus]SHK61492.1 hypothetical protein SAMN05216369_2465 [Marinobacter antarcticus]